MPFSQQLLRASLSELDSTYTHNNTETKDTDDYIVRTSPHEYVVANFYKALNQTC